MTATALDLSAIRTDVTTYAGTFRTLIGVYSEAEVDALIAGLDGLTAADIDTLAEINAILTDANLASIAYVDALAANYATAAQGALADTALQPSDITSGTITAGTGDIDFDDLGGSAESPLVLTASAATETPLTIQAAASQTANLQEWKDSSGVVQAYIDSLYNLFLKLNGMIQFGTTVHSPRIRGDDSGRQLNLDVGDNRAAQHSISGVGIVLGVQSSASSEVSFSGALNRVRTAVLRGSDTTSGHTISPGNTKITAGSCTGGTNANGGNVEIFGGSGIGTGTRGQVILSTLPTSDPAVSGAIWNDGGTLKISTG